MSKICDHQIWQACTFTGFDSNEANQAGASDVITSRLREKLITYLIGEKKSGKIFVGEKFSHFLKISHFSPTNFSNSSLSPDQFLKLKGLS